MELIFLGTGAAEGNPAAYCRCPVCEDTRKAGGKNIRTRSSVRLGVHCQIDISPDAYSQVLNAGTDMYDVETVLVTHTHEDHFDLPALLDKSMAIQTNGKALEVGLSVPARSYVQDIMARNGHSAELLHLKALDYYREYQFGDLSVRTVKGNHKAHGAGEHSINYLVTIPSGRSILYACDTGAYNEETWRYLTGTRVDTLVLECTFAGRTDRGELPTDHQDLRSFAKMLERMAKIGFIDDRTAVYATHFNPHQGLSHEEICSRLKDIHPRATAAYDCLKVEV